MNEAKLLQRSFFSRTEQNGHVLNKISLSRGCRQGDPYLPICLSSVQRYHTKLKIIKIGDTEIKLSQYMPVIQLFT